MRSTMSRLILPRRVATVLTLLMLLAGCSSDAVPEGFVAIERDAYSLAVPEGWEVTADEPTRTAITGVQDVEEVFESAIVQVDDEFFGDFRAATRAIIEPLDLFIVQDLEEVEERAIEVDGASEALVVEITFASEVFDGRTRQYLVFAIPDEEGPMVFVQMGAPEPIFDRSTFDQMLDSLTLR